MSGPRSEAPVLPGFTPRRWLGGGGFADVFLYLQHKPEREVAVKVLRAAALDQEALDRFDAEANLMARVSTHPHIVTVYTADVAADGRPYLVMEYYPKPHFGERCRAGGLPVADVLRVGIQVSS
ncbi:MAG: protein kinase domain-containing protein, partial [Actinomycetes bacterium]